MIALDKIQIDFSLRRRTVHCSASEKITVTNKKEVEIIGKIFEKHLARFTKKHKCYVVIDLGKFDVSTELFAELGKWVKKIYSRYIIHTGVAIYGTSISRITFKLIVKNLSNTPIEFFDSKSEAYDYIDSRTSTTESMNVS